MDWENERYVRRYVRETVDDAVLSWEAKALWGFLLDRFNRAGVLPMGVHGWKGVAILVRMPLSVVAPAAEELLADGRVEVRGSHLIAPNFMEAQEAKQSDKQRKAESRARQRDRVLADSLGVTTRDRYPTKESQSVTVGDDSDTVSHGESRLVTPTLAVPSLPDPSLAVPNEGPVQRDETPQPIEISAEAFEIADGLKAYVLAENPSAACSKRYPRKTWATTIDVLLKRYTSEQLRYSIGWLSGEQFGPGAKARFVVESAKGLANKIDSIAANIKSQAKRGQGSERTSAADARLAAQLAIEADEDRLAAEELEQMQAEGEAQQ